MNQNRNRKHMNTLLAWPDTLIHSNCLINKEGCNQRNNIPKHNKASGSSIIASSHDPLHDFWSNLQSLHHIHHSLLKDRITQMKNPITINMNLNLD